MTVLALTGAAGRLGSYLREPLAAHGSKLISSDLADEIGSLYPGEIYRRVDVAEMDQVMPMLEGVDTVVHFAAIPDEAPFEEILGPNFIGAYNIWEAAYRQGVKRVVYASSIHAVGMYPRTERIGVDAPHRPDSYYGLSKCFAEDLAYLYWTKRKLEAVCLRILSCAQVTSERALGTWLSYADLIQLVLKSVQAPVTGLAVIYGVSDNDRSPVDNAGAGFLGYRPKDNAERFAETILAEAGPADPAQFYHAGVFAKVDLGESGLAHMNIVDDRKK
ncbi:MAG: NAD(P)-dependent oxidoreductase [Pseudomonadota bacterium]